jgi:hypothetical protein
LCSSGESEVAHTTQGCFAELSALPQSFRRHLVQVRAGEYGSLRRLLLRQGVLSSKQQEIKTATEAELEQWFTHPLVRLHASQELQRIELYTKQIAELEKTILELAKTEQAYELCSSCRGWARPSP